LLRLLLFLLIPAVVAAQSGAKLLVISIDGLDARLLNDPALKVKAPNLRKLMREGASASVVGVTPSETWPAHASLVTGVSPWQHGVLVNDVAATAFKSAALWDVAAAKGLRVGAIYWPGTAGAKIAFNMPQLAETVRGSSASFDSIAQKSSPAGLARLIEKRFPAFGKELWMDASSAQAAIYLLTVEKPDLLFVHFSELDAEEHETGARSIYAREVLENNDDLVGQIVANAPAGMVIAVVSDHGFENSNRTARPRVMLQQAGVAGRVEVADGLIGTADPAVAAALRKMLADGRKWGLAREVPVAEVRAKAPSHLKWVAAFDTLPDVVATDEDRGPALGRGPHVGTHGMWPNRPGFRTIFIVRGAGVKPRKLGEIDMLQVAPTLADAVGLKLPAAKSASLWRQITQ
jgi:predicted AlkP superfamily pyrophosphatase or phosphodiesterase